MRFTLRYSIAVLLLLVVVSGPALAAEKLAVSVPIKLDYSLMQQLLVKQLFAGPGQSRKVLTDASSCTQILLTDPQLAPQAANLEIHARVAAQLGVGIFDRCYKWVEWKGGVGFLGLPVIRPGATSLGLKPQGMWLTTADGERVTSGRMWNYAEGPLQALFTSFTINLAPFTAALGSLLPDVLPNRSVSQVQEILDSLKLGNLKVAADSLNASLDFSVEALAEELPPEDILSPEELQQWESRWQMMDALLVFAVKHYAAATHLETLRSTLLELLIDSRYQLVDALAAPVDRSNDVVRAWFLDSWQRLSPVVRSIALEQEGKEPLMWMSVLAATDALYAMDQLGPQIGLEISADGLRRLARMINQGVDPDVLRYDDAVDPELQELFQQQIKLKSAQPSAWNFEFSLIPRAYAGTPDDRLNSWVPDKDEIGEYLPLVSELLDESSDNMLKKHKLDKAYVQLFKKLVLATAWQESCWRQYVVKDGRIEPLLSSTGDVGLMQMNERVWRGFYDLQKLRWDITYNSAAGTEVLLDYLVKYAIRRGEHQHSGGFDNLARASYSAYNGGPSKASRYRKEGVSSYHRKIDAAFWKKYQGIDQGSQSGIARCLGAVT
jgi:hypothetical protein